MKHEIIDRLKNIRKNIDTLISLLENDKCKVDINDITYIATIFVIENGIKKIKFISTYGTKAQELAKEYIKIHERNENNKTSD